MRPPARHLLMAAALELVWLGCAAPEKTAPCPSMALPATTPYALAAVQAQPHQPAAPKATNGAGDSDAGEPEQIEDDVDPNEQRQETTGRAVDHPLLHLSDDELAKRFESQPATLGSLSIGRAGGGSLVNGVQMPEGEHWTLVSPGAAWGTEETIAYLKVAIERVHQEHPGGHKLSIGHLSARRGGYLSPHKSHQSGRDVDISYFYRVAANDPIWFKRASVDNIDLERTWAFVRALVTETDVEYIFINSSIQKMLKDYALGLGEDPEWLDSIFEYRSRRGWAVGAAIVRHAPGHDTHIHVRFYSPVAQEMGRRLYKPLVGKNLIKPTLAYVQHRARKGDLLGNLAKRYGTSVEAIMRANGLRNTHIRAGRVYRIPKKGAAVVIAPSEPITIPPRRLPPRATSSARKKSAAPDDL